MNHTAPVYKEIEDKWKILRNQYGGMMSLENIKYELGHGFREPALETVQQMDITVTKSGHMKECITDVVVCRLKKLKGVA